MRMTRVVLLCGALLVALCAMASAAGQYKLTLLNNPALYPYPTYNANIQYRDSANVLHSEAVALGPVWIKVLNTSTNDAYYSRMLCVDIQGTINWGQTWDADLAYDTPDHVAGVEAWSRAVYIAKNATGGAWALGGATTGVQDAAIQTAIWEVIQDDPDLSSWNLGADRFSLSSIWGDSSGNIKSQIASTAYGYFSDAFNNAGSSYGNGYAYFKTVDPALQDLIYFVPPTPPQLPPPVPEFPAVALGPLGCGIVAMLRRRFSTC